jgi:hypothetical protein
MIAIAEARTVMTSTPTLTRVKRPDVRQFGVNAVKASVLAAAAIDARQLSRIKFALHCTID